MAFERKEVKNEESKTILWNILRWYWLLIPTFYFLILLPRATQGGETPELHPDQAFSLIFQLMNYGLAGILTVTDPMQRSKSGTADLILKIAAFQQFLSQNIFGLILTIIVWYQLPYRVKAEDLTSETTEGWYFQSKTLIILTNLILGITILVIIGQLSLL